MTGWNGEEYLTEKTREDKYLKVGLGTLITINDLRLTIHDVLNAPGNR